MTDLAQAPLKQIFPPGPRVGCYFPSDSAERARTALIRCIERSEGPALLMGPSGTGKSLILAVLAQHFRGRLSIASISGGALRRPRELHQAILHALGLPFRGLEEGELRLSLLDRLETPETGDEGVLILVDEAQSLNTELIEELRMLTNVVRDGLGRVRLVMAGTPSLEELLTDAHLESFQQRIAVRSYLNEMSRSETRAYVQAHLDTAEEDVDLFTPEAVRSIHETTEGLPRLINQLCDHSLLLAQAEGLAVIDADLVDEAFRDLQQLPAIASFPSNEQQEVPAGEVIEFGSLQEFADSPEADSSFGDPRASWQSDFDLDDAEITQGGHGFSIVHDELHDEPVERIDAIAQHVAALHRETEPAVLREARHGRDELQIDFTLPEEEWPEVEVVLRDLPAKTSGVFHEEEVVADPFLSTPARRSYTWGPVEQTDSMWVRTANDLAAVDSEGHRDFEPLESVPLVMHVQTDFYTPDPVLPDEREPSLLAAALPGSVRSQREPAASGRQPGLVPPPAERCTEPHPGMMEPGRPKKTHGPPAQRKFARLFSSLQE
jgi:type II secretory pathway predicted ATPase ExeA